MAMRIVPEHPRSCFNTMSASVIRFLEEGEAVQTGCLYEHQVDAVLAVRNHLHDPSKPKIALVVLPTGCGKTGVAVLAPYALSASRVLVITPSVIISKQIHEAFVGSEERDCFLIERGIIDREDKDQYCCLPSAACITLAKQIRPHLRDNLMIVNAHKVGGKSSVSIHEIPPNAYDLVIVDEAHHYPAQTWKLLVDHFQSRNRLFLTATPEHCGKYILPDLSDHIAYRISHENAVERGIIRPIDFKDHVDSRWDMTVEQVPIHITLNNNTGQRYFDACN